MRCGRGGIAVGALALAGLVMPMVGCRSGIRVGGPSIEGTYQFMSRDLPDGTRVTPPDIAGMLTFTDNHRHFNIYWTNDEGQRTSISSISKYELINDRYWEQCIVHVMHDEIDETGVTYDLSMPGGSSDVTVGDNGVITFTLPLFNEPRLVFTRHGFTATREGAFVDHWRRID